MTQSSFALSRESTRPPHNHNLDDSLNNNKRIKESRIRIRIKNKRDNLINNYQFSRDVSCIVYGMHISYLFFKRKYGTIVLRVRIAFQNTIFSTNVSYNYNN